MEITTFGKKKMDNNNYKESVDYFLENLDDPEIIFNKICFLCNNATPSFSSIQTRGKDEEDSKIKDLEANNFELGLIKIAENQQKAKKHRKKTMRK